MRTDEELSEAFDRLPENGKHFIALIRSEFADLRGALRTWSERWHASEANNLMTNEMGSTDVLGKREVANRWTNLLASESDINELNARGRHSRSSAVSPL